MAAANVIVMLAVVGITASAIVRNITFDSLQLYVFCETYLRSLMEPVVCVHCVFRRRNGYRLRTMIYDIFNCNWVATRWQ